MKQNIEVTVVKRDSSILASRPTTTLNAKNFIWARRRGNGIRITSISSTTTTATATTDVPHGLATGDKVTIKNASYANHNKTDVSVTVTGIYTFTYTITSTNGTSPSADLFETTVRYHESGMTPKYLTTKEILSDLQAKFDAAQTAYLTSRDSGRPPVLLNAERIIEVKQRTDTALSVSGITRSSTTATATTTENHNLATNDYVTVAGADQSDYNITAQITVTSPTTFTYTVANSPTTPATGTITATPVYTAVTYDTNGARPEEVDVQELYSDAEELFGVATATTTGNTVTVDAPVGTVTTSTLTTAAQGTQAIAITNRFVSTASRVEAWISDYSGTLATNGTPYVAKVVSTAGTITVTLMNIHASNALNGTVTLWFKVLN